MNEREQGPESGDFYIPTPEELEQGGLSSRRRRRDRSRRDRGRGRIRSHRAGRLFSRLRRGVGQKRTEARAPRPATRPHVQPQTSSEPSPTRSRSHPSQRDSAKSQEAEVRQRSQPPVSKPTAIPETLTSKKRPVRRIAVPERKVRPTPKKPLDRVPAFLIMRVKSLGHDLGPFEERPGTDPQQELHVAKCKKCALEAFARRSAPRNYTLKDNGHWEPISGRASERRCPSSVP